MSRRFEIELVPAALVAALIALLAAQFLYHPLGVETVTEGSAPWLPPLPVTIPLQSTAAIEARPLFDPTRGAASATDPGSGVAATIDGVILVGVASRGRRAIAVLRGADAVVHTLERGQQLAGWTLESVGADAVVLARGDERRTIAVGATAAKGPGE